MVMRKLFCFIVFIGLLGISNANAYQVNGSVIKGKVTDINGSALPGAGITIENTFLGVHTDADGTYTFPGLKDGNYKLRFSFIGYETQVQEVILRGEAILNISLIPKLFMTEEVFVSATRAG